ncbi:hypothetical protein OROMI_010581 [Orobanche minor]
MTISVSIIRYTFSLIAPRRTPDSPLRKILPFSTYSSTAVEKFLPLLEEDRAQVEKTLDTVKANLDSKCITRVLERCAIDKPQLGVRFFIWAALHPTHRRTSSHMYNKACKLLHVEQNPRIIVDVIDKYKAEGSVVSANMFKVVLNLCKAAKDANLALWVLRKMKEFNCRPDTVSYNVVIRLLVDNSQLDEAMSLLGDMGLIDLYPDMITYVSIIKGCCDAGRLDDASRLIKVMKGHGCVPNAVVYSTLLDGICRHGSLELASEFLSGMEKDNGECKPNLVIYTTMIKGFIEKGMVMDALRVFNRMDDFGIRPNKVAFIAILDGLCKQGHIEEAREVVDKFSGGGGGFQYDELYSFLVVSLMRAGKHKDSENMFRMMMARGMKPSGMASGGTIRMMVLGGRVLDGCSLFGALEKSGNLLAVDSEIYSILLNGLCEENHFIEAAKLVHVMVERKIRIKSSRAEKIIKHLNISGEHDLASDVSRIKC